MRFPISRMGVRLHVGDFHFILIWVFWEKVIENTFLDLNNMFIILVRAFFY